MNLLCGHVGYYFGYYFGFYFVIIFNFVASLFISPGILSILATFRPNISRIGAEKLANNHHGRLVLRLGIFIKSQFKVFEGSSRSHLRTVFRVLNAQSVHPLKHMKKITKSN